MIVLRLTGLRKMSRKTWSEGNELALSTSTVKWTIAVDKQRTYCFFTTSHMTRVR